MRSFKWAYRCLVVNFRTDPIDSEEMHFVALVFFLGSA